MKIYLGGPDPREGPGSEGIDWRFDVEEQNSGVEWVNPVEKVEATDYHVRTRQEDSGRITAEGGHIIGAGKVDPTEDVEEALSLLRGCDGIICPVFCSPSLRTWREAQYARERGLPVAIHDTRAKPGKSPITVWATTLGLVTTDIRECISHIRAQYHSDRYDTTTGP